MAELLVEHLREFVWGGRLGQVQGWVRRLPRELLLAHRSLAAVGALAAVMLARPEVEVQRLLAVAERAKRERPEGWTRYAEAVVEVTRAAVTERGDVGAAVEHARRAGAAARVGADVLTRRRPRELGTRPVLRRRARRDQAERIAGGRAAGCAGRSHCYAASLGLLTLIAATGLSRREIGARLYISVNTVKTHTRELYRRLSATSRMDAVARAEALGLLTESPG